MVYALGVAFVAFHLYVLNVRAIDPWVFRSTHVAVGLAMGFVLFAGWGRARGRVPWLDWLFVAASLACGYYIYSDYYMAGFRFGVMPTTMDVAVSLVGILLILELTRRTTGWALPALALIFLAYALAGPYMPGILEHRGLRLERLLTYVYSLNGIFGVTISVSATYLILFITFAAFLQTSGVSDYFIKLAFALSGTARGGPAKVAVIASALMGSIQGTASGNAVATGSLTIPLMRHVGYSRRFAAAVEATASSGGQILPPIMGAGAFIMAEVTGIPYRQIALAAIIPALLFFVAVYFMVDLEAVKRNLRGLPREQLPDLREALRKTYLFIPVVVLVATLFMGYSVVRAGTVGILSCLVVSWMSREHRMGLKAILDAMALGARQTIGLIAVCACAGIVVGVIAQTGLGHRVASMLLSVAQESQLLALGFAMIVAIVLGMGMPTTAAYAVAASVVAPGLVRIGIEPLTAHMFIFYYAVISGITPPVAVAAYAAAGIAGSDPMKTSVQAFRLGLAAFIVPFMFYYSPTLLAAGDPWRIGLSVMTALLGVFLLASAVQSWFMGTLKWPLRVLMFLAALSLISGQLHTDLIGLAILGAIYFVQRRQTAAASRPSVPIR